MLDIANFSIPLPRITALYHTEEFSPIETLPITLAFGAMKEHFNSGMCLPRRT